MAYTHRERFVDQVQKHLKAGTCIRITLSTYRGKESALKTIRIRPVVIREEKRCHVTYQYATRDIVKHYSYEETLTLCSSSIGYGLFHAAMLSTLEEDYYLTILGEERSSLKRKMISEKRSVPDMKHDRKKQRVIETDRGATYLHKLNITDRNGKVYAHAQDKYRQIHHYIELLEPYLRTISISPHVVDMGSGKGYLTFALYDYLTHTLERDARVTGVEIREDLVGICNTVAQQVGFTGLQFSQGTIAEAHISSMDVLVALHACDTATDDAIAKGIGSEAELIVVAPCCHKQIRREIKKGAKKNELDFLTRHGIFMEREAEMVTDGIRALILEYFGYTTRVFQFISDSHTPKNIMIVGQKKKGNVEKDGKVLEKITNAKEYFGIGEHYLERVLGMW